MSRFEKDLSQGSVAKQLLLFAVPFIASSLIQSLYSLVDMIIVGQFAGTVSMSGVNMGSQVTGLLTIMILGLSVGGTVLIGQYKGGGAREELKQTIGTLLTLLFYMAVILTVLVIAFCNPILTLLQTPPEAFEEARRYLIISAAGLVFIFGYNAFAAVLRGMGDSRHPLWFVLIACGANLVLDLLLVAVFHLGAAGAAVATVVSQAVSVIFCLVFLKTHDFIFDFRLSSFRIHREQLRQVLHIGLPVSVQNVIIQGSFLFLTAMGNTFGVLASAGIGAVEKFNGFAILPAVAVGNSVSAMSAQNLGAGEEKRAVSTMKVGFALSFAMSLVMFLIVALIPGLLLRAFADDPEMIRQGTVYLSAFQYDYLIIPFFFCFNGLFVGSGHSLFTLINSVLASIVVRVPVAYLCAFPLGQGVFGVGIAAPVATGASVALSLIYFGTGRWKRSNILQSGETPGGA